MVDTPRHSGSRSLKFESSSEAPEQRKVRGRLEKLRGREADEQNESRRRSRRRCRASPAHFRAAILASDAVAGKIPRERMHGGRRHCQDTRFVRCTSRRRAKGDGITASADRRHDDEATESKRMTSRDQQQHANGLFTEAARPRRSSP